MKNVFLLCALVMISLAPPVAAQDQFEYVLPAFAFHHPGVGDNLWSSEIFITNPGDEVVSVRLGEFLPGRIEFAQPCLPPEGVPKEVPGLQTIVWAAREVAIEKGCATGMVGGLVFVADAEVSITSRMVNEQIDDQPVDGGFIPGFGLEVPAWATDEAAVPGELLLLPTLVWHPRACANPEFETAVGVVNLSQDAITVRLSFTGDVPPERVFINRQPIDPPFEFPVPGRGWRQVSFGPPEGGGSECLPAEVFDLQLEATGDVVAYGTVVDRSTQDGRIVLPVAVVEDATSN